MTCHCAKGNLLSEQSIYLRRAPNTLHYPDLINGVFPLYTLTLSAILLLLYPRSSNVTSIFPSSSASVGSEVPI